MHRQRRVCLADVYVSPAVRITLVAHAWSKDWILVSTLVRTVFPLASASWWWNAMSAAT
ncbi:MULTISPECIES: hypothetical protein [unclassified Streptomyces]|uniref:hypothetical protein n=1 Tax=unclassified Streptomyces TaxID=2593676 RepID=UPI0021E0032A|nr:MULTISPECIES: hypothetical protein [unclassified Streptomyces]